MLGCAHGKGADDAGQGGKRSRHDISLVRGGGFGRMDKLSAKMKGFATVRYEALGGRVPYCWAGIGQRLLLFPSECAIEKQKLTINRKKFNF